MCVQMGFEVFDRVLGVVEDGGGEGRIGLAGREDLHEMIEILLVAPKPGSD